MTERDARKLILRMHRGDELAAQQLWGFVAYRLVTYARVTLPTGMGSAAEDVVQGVFLKVLKLRRGTLRGIGDGTAYLYQMTRNEALNYGRGETRERARRRATPPIIQTAHDDRIEPVLKAITELPSQQQDVLVLRYVGGLTIDQVVEVLGVNRNTVASRSRLGVERLRDVLKNEVHDD